MSQTLTFISHFHITDSAALADLHVGFALPEMVAMIEVVAVATFKICATVTVVEISSKEEPLLHCQGLAEYCYCIIIIIIIFCELLLF